MDNEQSRVLVEGEQGREDNQSKPRPRPGMESMEMDKDGDQVVEHSRTSSISHEHRVPLSVSDEIKSGQSESVSTQEMTSSSSRMGSSFSRRMGLYIDPNASDDEKKRMKFIRNTKFGIGGLVVAAVVGGLIFWFEYGLAKRDEEGRVVMDQYSGLWMASVYRMRDAVHFWKDYVVEPSREVLLPNPLPRPYHQPKYTVVLEMKNVLIAPEWTYKSGYRFKKRPALDYFLDVIGYPNFEVVIYTSESGFNAQPIVDSLDPKQRIMYKLYRDCTKYMNKHHVKDLSRLNRDLKRVIYIDFDPKSFQLNPDSVLRVPKWDGDMEDTGLVDLAELLKTIHLSDVDDVRPTLQYYSQFEDPAKEFRRRALFLAEQETKKSSAQSDQRNFAQRYAGRLFGFRRHQS